MSWLDAAKNYARSRMGTGVRPTEVEDVIEMALLLGSFASSRSGFASMVLLEASGKVITCGQDDMWVYCWGQFGPTKIPRAFFLSSLRRPHPATATELARSLVRAGMRSGDVMRWLRDELDKVAHDAPEIF